MASSGRTIFEVNTSETLEAHIGPALIFLAPFGTTFPTKIDDVVNLTGDANTQWTPKTGWTCLGATKTGIKIDRGYTKIDRSSDQSFGPYDSRPNNWMVTVSTDMLQTTPENLAIGWAGSPVSTDASTLNGTSFLPITAGATTFQTATTPSSVVAGEIILNDVDTFQEWHTVLSVAVNTPVGHDTVTLAAGETFFYSHLAASTYLVPGRKSAGYGRPLVLPPRLVSVIAPVGTQSTTLAGGVVLMRMWSFRFCRLQDGQHAMTLSQDNDWTLPIGFMAYKDHTVLDSQQNTFSIFDLTGV